MHKRNSLKLALSLLLIPLLFSFLLILTRAAPPPPEPGASADLAPAVRTKIEPLVLKELAEASWSSESAGHPPDAQDGKTTYIVYLSEQADLRPAQRMAENLAISKLARRQAVVSALQATAQRTQADIVAYLDQQKSAGQVTDYTSYWVFNGLAVTGDLETLLALAARPEVDAIRANHKHQIQPPISNIQSPTSNLQTVEWNIARVRADQVWSDFDIAGAGVVVANMDTGVDWTHPALQSKYRGSDGDHNYNWYDATGTYPSAPADGDGHGTHTMGTIVGSDPSAGPDSDYHIGMAPAAQWTAVKVLDDDGVGYDTEIHAGFQWLLAPTDLDGNNPDPGKAPDVVNNSWGPGLSNVADLTFLPDVQALRAAGIFLVFSTGNIGDLNDGSIATPAGFPESFSVGATDFQDAIASFSSRGPSFWEELKPEVSAPGVDIRSSVPDGGYEGGWSGTSMAAPHAAGLAALLLSANPTLTVDELENFMKYTATDFGQEGPDNTYGWGRIDAYEAVRWVLGAGKLYGKVTASNAMGEGLPTEPPPPRSETFGERGGIPGATVSGVSQAGDVPTGLAFIVTADDAGVYEVSVPGGLYDITASAFGYYSETVKAVEVVTGFMSVQDLVLPPSPTGTLAGWVTEMDTGEPLTATISAIDTPITVGTDANGYYTLTLPVGSYPVEASMRGHQIQRVEVSIAEGAVTSLDFALETAPSILLVDADAWLEDSVANYYQWALDYEGYLYDTRPITDTDYLPTAAELSPYDVVIWASPWSSPGYINADEELIVYLDNGGRLLISGQDVGYWDGKWPGQARAPLFYHNYLYADYVRDRTRINDLTGVDDDIFEGVNLLLEDVYAYKKGNASASDEVTPADGYASAIISYEGDGSAGLKTDVCGPNPYRTVYLSFGYEGAGPRPDYAAVLDKAIQWLIASRPLRETSLRPKAQYKVGEPGTSIQYSARVANDGQVASAYDLSLSDNAWPTAILDPQTKNPITKTAVISPCGWLDLLVQVDIPDSAATGEEDTVTVQATMAGDPSIFSTAALTTRAFPAWDYASWLPTSRYRLAAATVGCELYAIGGWDWTGASTVNEVYDPAADFWSPKAPKPTGAANVGAAVLNGRIYVVGGMTNSGLLSAVEVYDPATDSWSSAAPLPVGLAGAAVAAAGGKLYVFGGGSASGDVNTTYEYDPAADTWAQKAPMPGGPRSYAAATTLPPLSPDEREGRIYVAGGWPDLRTFEEYDPASDTWATKAPLLRGRQSLGLAAIGGYIYAVGGGSYWSALGYVERYDPATDTWVLVSSLNKGRIGTGTAAVGGGIYVVGGLDIYGEAIPTNEALALENSLCPSLKKVDKVTATPGEVLTYTIALRNLGDSDFAGVSLADPIPAHTTYVSGSISGGAGYDAEADQIEWSGTVAAGTSITFTFQVTLDDPLLGETTIANVAAINGGNPRYGSGTSFTKKTATKVRAANLETSIKEVDKAAASSGEVLTYTIVLSNTGSADAVGASLVDPLPAHITYVPDSATGGAVYNPALNRIEWTGVVSPTVSEKTPSVYSWLDSETPGGPIYHWEEISETGTEVASWTNRNDGVAGPLDIGFDFPFFGNVYSDTLYLGTNGYVSLGQGYSGIPMGALPSHSYPNNDIMPFGGALYIMDGVSHVYYQLLSDPTRFVIEYVDLQWCCGLNTSHTFEIVLYPSGEILTQYQSLHGDIPWVVGIENEDGSEGLNYPPSLVADGLAIKYLPPAPPNPPHTISFQARVNDSIPPETVIANTATINDGMGFSYARTATTTANTVNFSASTKTVEETSAVPGDVLTYTIVLRNGGDAASFTTEAGFTDPIPAHTSYVSDSVTGGAIYDDVLNRIQWSGTVPAGGERTFTFAVTTVPSLLMTPVKSTGLIVNVATISDGLHQPFTRTATTTLKRPDLSASEKLVSAARADTGDILIYTLRVKNAGEGLARATLTDTIPVGAVYVPGSAWAGNGTVAYDEASDRIIWNGEVPPRGMTTIVFAVTVTEERVIHNTATINDGLGGLTERSAMTKVHPHDVYLPLIVKNYGL